MKRPRLPRYVHAFIDRHGKPRYYLRRPGFKRVPLPGLPYSPEFMEAHAFGMAGNAPKIEIGASRTRPGTVDAAVIAYYGRPSFTGLAPQTRNNRRAILERFRAEHGDKRIALLQRTHIVHMLGKKKPFAARNWLKTLRGLMAFVVLAGYRQDNPTDGIKTAKAKTDGIHTWNEDEIARYRAKHELGMRPRLAFELLLNTAQRRSDVVRMGRQHIHGAMLTVRQQKTGQALEIPLHPDLQAAITAMRTSDMTFLVTERGQPFTAAGFGNWFRDRCDEAGLPARCSAHGLRKAACRRLAEAGCSAHQIAAISGHLSLSEVQRYTKAADQAKMARAAMELLRTRTSIGKPKRRFAKSDI